MKIKERTLNGIERYVKERIRPGGFLMAVLENNLRESIFRADEENRASLYEIVSYLYWSVPGNCWGSPEIVKKWLEGE